MFSIYIGEQVPADDCVQRIVKRKSEIGNRLDLMFAFTIAQQILFASLQRDFLSKWMLYAIIIPIIFEIRGIPRCLE